MAGRAPFCFLWRRRASAIRYVAAAASSRNRDADDPISPICGFGKCRIGRARSHARALLRARPCGRCRAARRFRRVPAARAASLQPVGDPLPLALTRTGRGAVKELIRTARKPDEQFNRQSHLDRAVPRPYLGSVPATKKYRLPTGARPAPLPLSVSFELATACPEPPAGEGLLYEVKHDGHRLTAIADGTGGLRLLSRNGPRPHPTLCRCLRRPGPARPVLRD